MKVEDSVWFTTMDGCIGIVLGVDETTGKHKAYIGTGSGYDERADAAHIAQMGTKVSLELVQRLSLWLDGEKEVKEMITRDQNTVTCPNCKHEEEVAAEIFGKMLEIPWVNYLAGSPISVPLKCPSCGHTFREYFIFARKN